MRATLHAVVGGTAEGRGGRSAWTVVAVLLATLVPVTAGHAVKDETVLISAMPGARGAAANDASQRPAVSGDGRYVAFSSWASNLAADDYDRAQDVFVRDVQGATTTLVSRASGVAGAKGNGESLPPDISADGRYVVFGSTATNLDPADGDVTPDIYVRDLQLGTTTLVSRADDETKANGESRTPTISDDGRYVSFESLATNLDPADMDATADVFVRDLVAGTTQLVSRASGVTGDAGNDQSTLARISGDGQRVAFASMSSNLDPADDDALRDVFVRDLQSASTTLVSRATGASGAAGNGHSDTPDISGDGRYVTFASAASNLDVADVDTVSDVYVRDLAGTTTVLVSRANGDAGAKGASASSMPRISSDGWWVAFSSSADNLDPADADGREDVFARGLPSGTTWLVSRADGFFSAEGDESSFMPAVSDGARVAFISDATNLDPLDRDDLTPDAFIRDVLAGRTTMVSRASGTAGFKDRSGSPSVSADGRFVAFESASSRLDPIDDDTTSDVFVHDTQSHALTLVSRGTGEAGAKGRGHSYRARIAGDGRHVIFSSEAAGLDPDDADTIPDAFVRDLQASSTTLVSRASGAAGEKADGYSSGEAISADGRYAVFRSTAPNLPGGGAHAQLYVRDLQTATTTLVSRSSGESGVAGDGPSSTASISGDGRHVVFISSATNLDSADVDPGADVYVRDLVADTTTLVSRASGSTGVRGDAPSYFAQVADEGDHVAFSSYAANLDDRDGDPREDVFVRDLNAATTTLVSVAGSDGDSSRPSISADGRFVAFQSTATDLHPDDGDDRADMFVRDMNTGAATLASRASGASGAKGNGSSFAPALSAGGRYVAFESSASNLDPRDGDAIADIFVRDVLGAPLPDRAASPQPAPPVPPAPAPVPPPRSAAPSNLVAPSIKGRAILGRRLSCARGRWTGAAPMRFRVRWVRGGRVVRRNARYRVGASDVGRRLACRVTASNAAGSASAASRAVLGRDELVPITTAGTLRVEVGEVRSRVCRGAVFLTLLRGDRLLARHTLALDGRCRWTWTFKVGRTRLGSAREVLVKVRFAGNALRFPVVYTQVEKVPRR